MNALERKQTTLIKKVASNVLGLRKETFALETESVHIVENIISSKEVIDNCFSVWFHNPSVPDIRANVKFTCNRYDTEHISLAGEGTYT